MSPALCFFGEMLVVFEASIADASVFLDGLLYLCFNGLGGLDCKTVCAEEAAGSACAFA